MRQFTVLGLAALVACSAAFSARVADFSVPITNTLGRVCWIRVDTTGAPRVRTASYRAQATYDPGALGLTDGVTVRFFGRHEAPASNCTSRDEASDLPLSPAFELERESSQPVVVGGAPYAEDLGDLVNEDIFWLGASAAGNVGVDEELRFRDGRITVGF